MVPAVAEPETVANFTAWVVAARETVLGFMVNLLQSLELSQTWWHGGRRAWDCHRIQGPIITEPETFHKFHEARPAAWDCPQVHANPSREARKAWANPHNPIRECAEPEKSRIVQNTNNNNKFVSNYYLYFCPINQHRPAPRLTSPFVYPVLAVPRPARHLLHGILSSQRINVQTNAFCSD